MFEEGFLEYEYKESLYLYCPTFHIFIITTQKGLSRGKSASLLQDMHIIKTEGGIQMVSLFIALC